MTAAPVTGLYVVGMNDEQTTCDACGRVELKGTVILRDGDHNEVGRYGTTCASRLVGYAVSRANARARELARRQNVSEHIRHAREALAHRAAGWALWEAREVRRFLNPHTAAELATLANIEAAADALTDLPRDSAIVEFQTAMRTVYSVYSGSGALIGYEFPGAQSRYPTATAAYLAYAGTRP